MMTYLKHVGNKKHSDLKSKTFEEIQALYEKVKRFDESFTAVGSTEDERRIKEMNEGVKDTDQKRLKEEDISNRVMASSKIKQFFVTDYTNQLIADKFAKELYVINNASIMAMKHWLVQKQTVIEGLVFDFMASQDARLSKFKVDFKRQQEPETGDSSRFVCSFLPNNGPAITIHPKQPKESQVNEPDMEQEEGKLGNTNSNPQSDPLALIATEQVRKLNSMVESLGLVPQSSNAKFVCSKEGDGDVMFIDIIRDNDEPRNEGPKECEGATMEEPAVEYFDTFPTREELTYHRENANGGISNFTGRIKGMHVFIGNFTYVVDFVIVEDISSIIDPRLSQVVLGRPFVEISNMTHDSPEGVVRFIRWVDEVAYKMPHKIEQYESLLDLEKEHTKSVYLRNEEDKRRGVEYVMSKILGFYKECL
ncbi:hypothetical protein Tco_0269532 [Tanacetum coccineum]